MYTVPSTTVWATPACETRAVRYYNPAPQPPVYYEKDMYVDDPGVYVVNTLVPVRRRPVSGIDCLAHCIGGLVYGAACCLAATVGIGCSCIEGLCRAATRSSG